MLIALGIAMPSTAAALAPIHDLQGTGGTSPFAGQSEQIAGIVTAVTSDGYFVQMTDASTDADPATSEGIFVFTNSAPPAGAVVGNSIAVTGTVTEFKPASDPQSPGFTELTSPGAIQLFSTGNPLPTPVALSSSDPSSTGSYDELEHYESMRVVASSLTVWGPTEGTIDETNATAATNGLFFGTLNGGGRPFREAGIQPPDTPPSGTIPPIPRWDGNPEVIAVDSDAAGHTALNVGAGAAVTGLAGVLGYSGRHYTLLVDPGASLSTTGAPTITSVPAAGSGEYTIGTLNLQRFFDTTDALGVSDAVPTNAAFQIRLAKASLAIRQAMHAPDIVVVEEVENLATLQRIAAKISSDAGAASATDPHYVAYLQEGNDPAGIDTGFLVRTDEVAAGVPRVAVEGVTQELASATYTDPTTNAPATLFERPPLRLNAVVHAASGLGERITVIGVHLLGLTGVGSADVSGPSTEGARVRAKRKAGAEAIANLVQARQAASPNERIAVVGDVNAHPVNDGYVDVLGTIMGAPAAANAVVAGSTDLVTPNLTDVAGSAGTEHYSVVSRGDASALDDVLADDDLAVHSSGAQYTRIGTSFPLVQANDSTSAARVSDHDGLVAYFTFPALPSAEAGGPYGVAEGATVTLDGASGSDPQGDPLTYTWDLDGDNVFGETGSAAARGDETGIAPTFSAAGVDGPAQVTVKLHVSDGSAAGEDTATIDVGNVAPSATVAEVAGAAASATTRTITLGAADAAPADQSGSLTWTIDWGDGRTDQVTSTAPGSATHTYAGPGTYAVSVTARDDDGATGTPATISIVVATPSPAPTTPPGGTVSADPALASLALGSHVLRPLGNGPAVVAKGGLRVSFLAVVRETVVFTVVRRTTGRRVRGACVKQTQANRRHKPCLRRTTVGSFKVPAAKGPNSFHFSGRLQGRRLASGAYELQALPSLPDGRHGPRVTVRFEVP